MKKSFVRILIITALILGLVLSIGLLIHSIRIKEWNTAAASLAVITAIIASWSSQKLIWKQEDETKPKLIIDFDIKNRRGVTQLIIENVGGSSAFDLKIDWINPLIDSNKNIVRFHKETSLDIDIPIILKGQKYSIIVDGTVNLYEYYDSINKRLDFSGILKYKESKKQKNFNKDEFLISMEPYRRNIDFEDEQQNFYFHGAKLREELKEMNKTLRLLQKGLSEKDEKK